MKQTAVEWLYDQLEFDDSVSMDNIEDIFEQAKAKERSQNAEEYVKGFKDGKEYQIKLDELTFKSE